MQEQMNFAERSSSRAQAPDLSVIIVNWNVRDMLLENLRELFSGNADAAFEVLVIDNASNDGSVEAIRERFPKVQVIANEENRGFAAAVNQGLNIKSGKHVLLLNPDMRVQAGAIKNIINVLDANPGVGILSGKLTDEKGVAMHHLRRFPTFASQVAVMLKLPHLFPNLLNHYYGNDLDLEKEQSVDSVRGSFFAISGPALEKLGNFDEGYFIWFEEVDYCRRAREAGYETRYVPGIGARDLVGKSFAKRDTYWKQKQFTASMIHYFEKWHPRWQAFILRLLRPFVLGAAHVQDRLKR